MILRCLLAAAAVTLLAQPAAAELAWEESPPGSSWSAYAWTMDDGTRTCGLYSPADGDANFDIRVFEDREAMLAATDPAWDLEMLQKGTMAVTLDDGRRREFAVEGFGGVVWSASLAWQDEILAFLTAFAGAAEMTVELPEGDRWSFDLAGSDEAAALMAGCIGDHLDLTFEF